jgi:primosomal protein N'
MHRAAFSYFSKVPYERGAVLSIPIRKKLSQGVVMSCQTVSLAKAALRGATFSLRKLPPQGDIQMLPAPFLKTADELSEYYAAQPGAVLFALLPSEIRNGNVPISKNSEKVGTREHTHEIFTATREARVLGYQNIVRTSFAKEQSVILVVPTVEDGEFLFSVLGVGIQKRTYLLYSGLGTKRFGTVYADIRENPQAVLIIATPQYAFVNRSDVSTIILECSRSLMYRGHYRPYLDFRYALLVHARHQGERLISADTLIRTEDEFLLRGHRALPFEDHRPKRLRLQGTLKTIPMKDKPDGKTSFTLFSQTLLEAIEKTWALRGRTFLFCARRGLAPIIACVDCCAILRCPESNSPLSLQRRSRNGIEERWLVSSVSGFKKKANDLCSQCGSWRLRPQGIGVQHVYDELVRHFGSDGIFLFDHQSASTHKKAAAIRDAFYSKKKTVLVGTALALPYIHEPVDLSAVVNMDALRAIPSWRQQEEALGILLALREKTLGYVFAQTRAENDDVIHYAQGAATDAYYTEELAVRKRFDYPPYSTFIHLAWKKDSADAVTKEISEKLTAFNISLYGPPAAEERVGYGLIRVPRDEWPRDALVDILRSLSPSVRIIINPDRII